MSTDGHSSTITIDKAAAQRMKKTADAIVEQEQSAQDFTEDTPHVLGVSLADLGLIGKTAEKLAENSLFTLTDLEEFDGEIASLDGVTKKMATEIGAAIKKYRAKHPLPATDDGSASIDEPETTAPGRIASASEFELDEEAIRSALHVNLLSRLQKGEIPKLDKVLAIDRRIEQLGPGWIAVPADFGTPGDYRLIPLHPRNWDAPVGKDDPFAGGLVEYAGARWALGTVAESVVVKA
jgi:hypothetical protein